ncbi:hypothetical protein FRC20_005032 [Serendipita sp. 405]|nr:hypothetical protein FRC18_002632 [Serendipita sp. 400]KAG8841457.1 hypothetical protein FRC20_005032 [Serendipita sp. 405]
MTNAFISFGYFVGALLGLMVFHMWIWRAWRERRMILVEYYNQNGTNGRPDEEDRDGNDGWLMAMHARMKAQQEPPRIYEVDVSSSCCGSRSTAQENRLVSASRIRDIATKTKAVTAAVPLGSEHWKRDKIAVYGDSNTNAESTLTDGLRWGRHHSRSRPWDV